MSSAVNSEPAGSSPVTSGPLTSHPNGGVAIIETDGLTREFRVRDGRRRRLLTAVDNLTVRIEPGAAVGYIGANGAGKSTTIKMLTGILVPTAGSVLTCGLRPVPDRRRLARQVGVVFGQRSQLWWDLPVRESFRILAAIHSLTGRQEASRTAELVEQLELGGFLSVPVRQLSLGQRMRAEVAAALLHSPRLVILDEPTIGLDVLSKQRLREFLIGERRLHGTTLLLTTHDMGDVERLCDRILVIDHGRLAYDGDLPGLTRTVGAERVLVVDLAEPVPDLIGLDDTRHLLRGGRAPPAARVRRRADHGGEGPRRRRRPRPGPRPDGRGTRHRRRSPPHLRRDPLTRRAAPHSASEPVLDPAWTVDQARAHRRELRQNRPRTPGSGRPSERASCQGTGGRTQIGPVSVVPCTSPSRPPSTVPTSSAVRGSSGMPAVR